MNVKEEIRGLFDVGPGAKPSDIMEKAEAAGQLDLKSLIRIVRILANHADSTPTKK